MPNTAKEPVKATWPVMRQARRHIDHVLLGDAAVEQAVGVAGASANLAVVVEPVEVGIDGHDGHALGRRAPASVAAVGRARGASSDLGLGPVCKRNHGSTAFPTRALERGQQPAAACSAFGRLPVPTRLVFHERHAAGP